MFQCQISGKLSKLGEKCEKVVVQQREKVYTQWFRNEDTGKWEELEVGRGFETIKEINACAEGLVLWNSMSLEDRTEFTKHLEG